MIVNHIKELYVDVGSRNFSTLLGTEYHPDTSEPAHVHRLTPFYWQDPQR
jgi:hypothetical protein